MVSDKQILWTVRMAKATAIVGWLGALFLLSLCIERFTAYRICIGCMDLALGFLWWFVIAKGWSEFNA